MTLSVSGTPAATGVEALVSAASHLSPAEWALAAGGGLLFGGLTVLLARTRGPREELTDRWRREAREHRARDGGFITIRLAGAVVAGCGLYLAVASDNDVLRVVAAVGAVIAAGFALVDLARSFTRGPRGELAERRRREVDEDRGSVDLTAVLDCALFVTAIGGLAAMLVSPVAVVQWAGAAAAVGCALIAVGLGWIFDR